MMTRRICMHVHHKNARLLACDADEEMPGMEEKMIGEMYFWTLKQLCSQNLTVQSCNWFTHRQ